MQADLKARITDLVNGARFEHRDRVKSEQGRGASLLLPARVGVDPERRRPPPAGGRRRVERSRDDRRLRGVRAGGAARGRALDRGRVRGRPRHGLVRLDRPVRADRGGVRSGPRRVRPARARGRGRDQGAPAAEGRGLRRHALRRPQDGSLGRRARVRPLRRDPGLRRRPVRHHRPPRRDGAPRGPPRPGGTARPPPLRARRRAARGRRPRGRRLRARGRAAGRGDPGGRGGRVLAHALQPGRAHLRAQAGGALAPRGDRPARGAGGRPGQRPLCPDPRGPALVLPRRPRPPRTHGRARGELPRAAQQRPDREPHPGERPPERGRAQDLRLGGDHRRPDADQRHLRDELRPHARARMDGWVTRRCSR